MKHILLLCFITVFIPASLYAQENLHVTQQEKQMSHGSHNGYTIDVPQAKLKDVLSAWKKYIKRGDIKSSVERNGDEYQITGTILTNITAKPMNVYTLFKEIDNAVRITSYFTEDDAVFLSTSVSAEKSDAAEKLMKDFARMEYHAAVEDELNDETKKLAKMESEKESLINNNEKANKSINQYERKIDHAKKDIETNDEEQSKRRGDVANQKEVVRAATPKTDTYTQEDKKLSSLEKELKGLTKDGENLQKNVDDWNADIRQEQRNIEKTNDQIKDNENSISKQKEHLKDVKTKMENIG